MDLGGTGLHCNGQIGAAAVVAAAAQPFGLMSAALHCISLC
jgi:hypothetical protein